MWAAGSLPADPAAGACCISTRGAARRAGAEAAAGAGANTHASWHCIRWPSAASRPDPVDIYHRRLKHAKIVATCWPLVSDHNIKSQWYQCAFKPCSAH